MYGIDRNKSEPQVLVEILVRRNVTAAFLKPHLHVQLATFADGSHIHVFVQHFDVGVGFNHARRNDSGLFGAQVDGLGRIAVETKRNLLQVEDDVGGILYHSRNRLEFVQYAFNLHRRDGGSLDGRQQHATQRIADGCTETTFERLRPEVTVLVSERFGIGSQPFRFLKTFPKHL